MQYRCDCGQMIVDVAMRSAMGERCCPDCEVVVGDPRRWICNTFSIAMLSPDEVATVIVTPITIEAAREWMAKGPTQSSVGHQSAAAEYSRLLGVDVPFARERTALAPGDELLVGQMITQRMPEGTGDVVGASYRWVLVRVL